MLPLLLLLSLLLQVRCNPPPVLNVTCQSERDLHELLYSVCVSDPVCAYLYALDTDYHHAYRHAKFWHQVRLFDVFADEEHYAANPHHHHPDDAYNATPVDGDRWEVDVDVLYDANASSCYNLSELSAEQQSVFNYVALDRLKTHKQYYSRQVCSHFNERLVYDEADDAFRCDCPAGKTCNAESSHEQAVMLVCGLSLGLFLLGALFVLVIGLYFARRLRKLHQAIASAQEKT